MDSSRRDRRQTLLLLPSYTCCSGDSEASDEIGYGISVGNALRQGLVDAGHELLLLDAQPAHFADRLAYVYACYAELAGTPLEHVDAIILFHAFHQFPSEIRRILANRPQPRPALIAFTHGSHLDPSDEFRERIYPGMMTADFGNLMCLDRILLVSETFRATIEQRVERLAPSLHADFAARLSVCGLALDMTSIDACFADREADTRRLPILFNHSPSPAKCPEQAFAVIGSVMARVEAAELVVTRSFPAGCPGFATLMTLKDRFGDRVRLCGTMQLPDYYRTLWQSAIQVSTARHESFGVATLEAMYTGNCCLVPDRQAYPELTNGHGLYRSDADLAAMLEQVLRDPRRRGAIAHAQRQRSRYFTPSRMVGKIAAAIDEVVSATGRRAEPARAHSA